MKLFGRHIYPTKGEFFLLGSVDYAARIYKDKQAGVLNVMFFACLLVWHVIAFCIFSSLSYCFFHGCTGLF